MKDLLALDPPMPDLEDIPWQPEAEDQCTPLQGGAADDRACSSHRGVIGSDSRV